VAAGVVLAGKFATHGVILPPAVQAFVYDNDGNILTDGVWTYEWDAENRLWAMQITANAVSRWNAQPAGSNLSTTT